jgi:hypothetical protein
MDEAEFQALFGGAPGTPVPQVDPRDVKTIWAKQRDIERRHPGQLCAVAAATYIKPDANVQAVGYRATMLEMVRHVAPDLLKPWTTEDGLEDVVFRAIAEIPMEWIGEGVRSGWPFDPDEFLRRVREAA